MSRLPLLALAAMFLCAGTVAALADCSDYGVKAVEQQNENVSLGCGFSGLRWHSDAAGHAAFCNLVGEGSVSGETAIREAELAKCRPATAVADDDNSDERQCQRSQVAEGTAASTQRARGAAHSMLGRERAEMVNSGLTECLYHDLGCAGENGDRTCWLSVECCAK